MQNSEEHTTSREGPIRIDVGSVLRSKLGSKMRYVPRWLVHRLERIIRQDELNSLLTNAYPRRGGEFCRSVLSDLGISVEVVGEENLPTPEDRRVILVSNHPLGGLDGLALIDTLSKRYGPHIRFLVNDLLMAVEPLGNVFLPINKHGGQSRGGIHDINKAMEGDDLVIVFPAGLVSRKNSRKAPIEDLVWQKMFVAKAEEYGRDIIPVYFSGENSRFFYNFARWRKRLGMKFNVEMILLPREMLLSRGKSFKIVCGKRIPWQTLQSMGSPRECARKIKRIVYNLRPNK